MGPPDDMIAQPIARSADGNRAPTTLTTSPHAGSPIAAALDDFDFGDYEGVVTRLRSMVENGARQLPNNADRLEALRIYGISCTLTDRDVAAEGAFLLLLREDPAMHLDAALVRPEAVDFFEEVRARHRNELVRAYRQGRPRYYFFADILPLVGQIQNREWRKLAGFASAEVALLASTITTAVLLERWQGNDLTFHGHSEAFGPLRVVNNTSFGLLLAVTTAGIVDGFVVGALRKRAERKHELQLGF
jgi:hypothetical protein